MGIRTAQSFVEEFPSASSSSVGAMAKLNSHANTERNVQSLATKFRLALPIEISTAIAGGHDIPWLRPSSWMSFLVRQNLWHMLAGLKVPDSRRCESIWTTFWERYRQINPKHSIFQEKIPLERTAAFLLHGDEGRSKKKQAIMVLSMHSALGYGIRPANQRIKEGYCSMRLNYQQNTYTTRQLLVVCPKHLYENDGEDGQETFQDLMTCIAEDIKHLTLNGVLDAEGRRFHIAILNVMGDWPFIAKCGLLLRHFHHVAKCFIRK